MPPDEPENAEKLSVVTPANSALTAIIAAAVDAPTLPEISVLAEALCERYGTATLGVLAYGSCLRGVDTQDSLVDLYVLVSSYRDAHGGRIEAMANQLLPPNVYYLEHGGSEHPLRSKYAVVSLDQFTDRVSAETANPYFWARFAQPCALVYARDDAIRARIHEALSTAARTAYANGCALEQPGTDWRTVWTTLLTATYGTELRPESSARAAGIVADGRQHFEKISAVLDAERGNHAMAAPGHTANWRWRRIAGKLLSVGRLIKAGFTFRGGADYMAWKIARHSGVTIEVTPWQRRHPIIAALVLAPRLYRKGGFK